MSVELQSQKSPVGGMGRLLTGLPGIDGKLGKLNLRISSQGRDGASLMRALSARLRLEKSQLIEVEGGSHHSTMAVGLSQYREALGELFSLR